MKTKTATTATGTKIPLPSKEALLKKEEDILRCIIAAKPEQVQQKADVFYNAVKKAGLSPDDIAALLHRSNVLYTKVLEYAGLPVSQFWDTYLDFCCQINRCKTPDSFRRCHSQMLRAYITLQRSAESAYSSMVQSILNYIQDNLSNRLDLQTLAQQLGFSPTYISHRFKKEMGISPMQYVTRMRMQTAAQLLRSSDSTIQEIAYAVGFSDLSYFSKLFHEHTGYPPTKYRSAKTFPDYL